MRPPQPLSEKVVRKLLAQLGMDLGEHRPEIRLDLDHSNDLAHIRFTEGRTLIIKRARYQGMEERFATSRLASELLHAQTQVLAPEYLEVPGSAGQWPTLVYWRIPQPTLDDIWPGLGATHREEALRDWGVLLARIHRVRLAGHGQLLAATREPRSLRDFVSDDLASRLRPAMEQGWPEQVPLLERMREAFDEALGERDDPPAVLVHGDLFTANVLCEIDPDVRCVGVIDFEDCFAGPREADLAKSEILHGPLFGRYFAFSWFETILEGYGEAFDATLVELFRAYHMMNMGYHASLIGLEHHAGEVARAIERELDALGSGRRHRDVVA